MLRRFHLDARGECGRVDLRRVTPQAFQPVKLSFFREKDVDDEVDVVHQDPLGSPSALDALRLDAQIPGQALLDVIRDRQRLPVRGGMADHEKVGDVTDVSEVEDDEVFSFLVQGSVDAVGDLGGQVLAQRRSSSR